MRTVKHLIRPVKFNHKNQPLKMVENLTEKEMIQAFLSVIVQYQKGKNYFLEKLNENNWNDKINFNHNASFFDIRNHFSKHEMIENIDSLKPLKPLKARMWRMALNEAFDTKLRTVEATLVKIKKEVNQKLFSDFKKDKLPQIEFDLLQYLTNSIFFNYSTFYQFETKILDKYRFISIFKQKYLPSFLEKAQKKFKSLKNFKDFKNFVFTYNLKSYLRYLKKKIKKHISFTNVSDIVGQINPTLQLDPESYSFYFNPMTKKYMMSVMGLNSHKERFYFELSGFNGKHSHLNLKKSNSFGNLIISYDATRNQFFIHFHFKNKQIKAVNSFNKIGLFRNFKPIQLKTTKTKVGVVFNPNLYLKNGKAIFKHQLDLQLSGFYRFLIDKFVKENKEDLYKSLRFAMGLDHGFNETFTSSHDVEFGKEQKEKLQKEAEIQHKILANTQKNSQDKYHFGIELKNKDNKRRNNQNHFYNHNANLKNINQNCRKMIDKSNRRLEHFYHMDCNKLLDYCQSNQVQFLCLEDLLLQNSKGKRRKTFNREVNLLNTGKIYELLTQKIKNKHLNIKIILVNPSYTSQMCSACGYVAKENREKDTFCCQQCGFGNENALNVLNTLAKTVAVGSKLDDLNASFNIRNLAMLKEFSDVFSSLLNNNRKDLKAMFFQLSSEYRKYVLENRVVTSFLA